MMHWTFCVIAAATWDWYSSSVSLWLMCTMYVCYCPYIGIVIYDALYQRSSREN